MALLQNEVPMAVSRPVFSAPAFSLIAALALIQATPAQKPTSDNSYASELPRIPPKTPTEALKAFCLKPGFRIELAAAEPLLASPVAIDFDEDGRLYVAEYIEFNQHDSKVPHGRGRVR